ncbi:MAG: ABC transporter permease [Lachnospiraceae bacterium]|nr:ABC transporter permease [Lachnospiraceae bacterium]
MLNSILLDFRRTLKSGKIFYIIAGIFLSIIMLIISIHFSDFFGINTDTAADSYCATYVSYMGFQFGLFFACLCLLSVGEVLVDYEYGNIKNICSVTKSRGTFIGSKLIYMYLISLLSVTAVVICMTAAGFILFKNNMVLGNMEELIIFILSYSFIADVPLTILMLAAMLFKRASFCSYILIALYIIPSMIYGMIKNYLGISLDKISVLQFAFSSGGTYDAGTVLKHGILAIIYTFILYRITVTIANRRDIL